MSNTVTIFLLMFGTLSAEQTMVSQLIQEPEEVVNLIKNPSFEDAYDHWVPSSRQQVRLSPGTRRDGQMSVQLVKTPEDKAANLKTEIKVTPGKLYDFGLYYRTEQFVLDTDLPLNGIVVELTYKDISFRRKGARSLRLASIERGSNWIHLGTEIFVPKRYRSLQVNITAHCKSGSLWIDDAYLVEKSAPKSEKRLKVSHGVYELAEIKLHRPDAEMPELSEDHQKAGFVHFIADNPDGYRRHLIPEKEQLGRPIKVTACPGEYEPAVFAVRTLKRLNNLRCTLTDLKTEAGDILPAGALDLRVVHFRLRLSDFQLRGRTFWNIPELLERFFALDLPANSTQPFWLTVHIPPRARPGTYKGELRFKVNDVEVPVPLEVTVRPFKLEEPRDIIWSLYVDAHRWRTRYPEDPGLLAELLDIRAHGIRSLCLAAERQFKIEGKMVTDWSSPLLKRAVPLMRDARIDGPVVLGLGFLEEYLAAGRIRGPLGTRPDWAKYQWTPGFQGMFMDALRRVRYQSERARWPELIYMGTEARPGDKGAAERAKFAYRLAKSSGFNCLFTGDPVLARDELRRSLAVRCFNPSISVFAGELAVARFRECRADGQLFWWRGTGTFNGYEGNMLRNRFMAGFLHYKSAADGCLIWTFQRPRGSAYNDFDGISLSPSFPKDSCLTYPDKASLENIPTPQWEGIREGIDDYRYAHTLQQLIDLALKSKNTETVNKAKKIADSFRELLLALPWAGEQPFEGKVTLKRLDAMREQIAAWIVELGNK
ncbi:MAG: hypothetical protein QGG53_29435 [Planctomycetota bacterium]|nr:hypothetical protein [Planctomycetota bacterium]